MSSLPNSAAVAPPEADVSAEFPFTLASTEILGSQMAYIDTDRVEGSSNTTTIVLLHGNPTSSYLYRNIIPHLQSRYRCVAPDLIGMGHSDKPDLEYRFVDHARYIAAFLDAVVPDGKIVFVIQDWGSALGFDWAFQHQSRIKGLAFMEFIRPFPTFDDLMTGPMQDVFRGYRDEIRGRQMIIEQNQFVETLPYGLVRTLKAEELDYYRRPYLTQQSREPVFRWPNEIPIEGKPVDVYERTTAYHEWLLQTNVPKLLFWAKPGAVLNEEKAKWYLQNLKNTTGVFLGEGRHFLQEDHPHRIGDAIAKWLETV